MKGLLLFGYKVQRILEGVDYENPDTESTETLIHAVLAFVQHAFQIPGNIKGFLSLQEAFYIVHK